MTSQSHNSDSRNNATQLTLAQIFGALMRHRYQAFLAWFVVMLMVTAAFILLPKKYGSQGQLYIQMGRNNSSISPTSGSASISIQDTRETEIRSVVEFIGSRAVLEAVVDDIGAAEILASPWDGWLPEISLPKFGSSSSGDMTPEEYAARREKEKATKALESSLDVHTEKKTSVISIYIKANSAKLAQRIVDRIIEHTRSVHLKVHASARSASFFDSQYAQQESKLVDAVEKLAKFRNSRNVLSVGAERSTLQNILSTLENDVLMAEVNVNQGAESLRKLQSLIAKTEAQIAVPKTGVERLSYEDSRTKVFELETERDRLVAKYSAQHPRVLEIDQQLKLNKASLNSMVGDRTESAMMSNPVYEDIKVDLIRAETSYSGSVARLKSLREKYDLSLEKLEDVNTAEVTADQLQRNVEVARKYLGDSTQKLGEALAMSLLDDKEISDIAVAQDATLGLKHISPKGSIFLPLGFIVGCFAALATALFYERNHLSPSLNEGEVEQVLGLPVLVTLPRVYSSRNMVN
jgi:uncharacterized protein involved in exopolysaccharide biosynthesis